MLDAAHCRQPVVTGRPVDRRQRPRAFGQYYLELRLRGTRRTIEVVRFPPDDELPVGRSSHRLSEDTAACAGTHTFIGHQIGIVREEGIQERILSGTRIHGHAPHPPEQFVVGAGEVYVAVRADRKRCNRRMAVYAHREGHSDLRGAVVAVVADSGAARGYRASANGCRITWRARSCSCRRRTSCRSRRRGWTGRR